MELPTSKTTTRSDNVDFKTIPYDELTNEQKKLLSERERAACDVVDGKYTKTPSLNHRTLNAKIYRETTGDDKTAFPGKLEIISFGNIGDVEDGTVKIKDELPVGFKSKFIVPGISKTEYLYFKIHPGKCQVSCKKPEFKFTKKNHTKCSEKLLDWLKSKGLATSETNWSATSKLGLAQTEKFVKFLQDRKKRVKRIKKN